MVYVEYDNYIGEGSFFTAAIIFVIGLTKLVPILRIYYDYPAQLSFMNVYAKRSLVPGAVIIDGMVST